MSLKCDRFVLHNTDQAFAVVTCVQRCVGVRFAQVAIKPAGAANCIHSLYILHQTSARSFYCSAGRGRVPVNSIACCHNAAVGFRSLLAPGKPIKRAKAFITAGRAPLPATYKFPCSNMARQNCESNASVAVRFRPESQSESDAADNSDGDTSNYATGEVRKRDHWATLLTTMPNLSSRWV